MHKSLDIKAHSTKMTQGYIWMKGSNRRNEAWRSCIWTLAWGSELELAREGPEAREGAWAPREMMLQ